MAVKKKKVITIQEYIKQNDIKPTYNLTDIAPVKKRTEEITDETTDETADGKWYQGWLKQGSGNFGQNMKATGVDVIEDLSIGAVGSGEKILDALMTIAPTVNAVNKVNSGKMLSSEDWEEHAKQKKESEEFIKKDLYDAEEVVKKNYTNKIEKKTGIDVESMSVFGSKADSLVQSAGQMGVTLATSLLNPAIGTSVLGATSFGDEMENALNNGANYDEAMISSTISAGAEILSEKISGAIKIGGKTLDELIPVEKLAQGISNKLVRNLINVGVDATGEGLEEIVSGYASAIGQKLTYMDEKEIKELFSNEDKLESFIGGVILGGVAGSVTTAVETAKGKDSLTGMSGKEKAVFDKLYNDAVKEQSKDGKKLSQKEKNKIYDETLKSLEKGYVDTDVIESALGGKTYEEYKKLSEEAEEFNTLYTTESGKLSEQQKDRLAQLKEKNASKSYETAVGELKGRLTQEVKDAVKGNKLLEESYNEKARKSQKYEADLTAYDENQQAVIKNAMDSGVLNNTNKTHDFVDFIAKLTAGKEVNFDFANNEKLKSSGFSIEGKTINGYVKGNSIVLNVNSAKALNTVVGHEITHVLEGTELYTELQTMVKEYATSKGEYDAKYDAIKELYKDVDGAVIENEVTADLIGEYLFTDSDFVNNLSTTKPNVFQKIFNEIKYLCKIATTGSAEEKKLLEIKKTFEKAVQESKTTENTEETKLSLSNKNIDKNTAIQYVTHNNYHNVAVNDQVALKKLQDDVRQIKRGTFENKASGYKADINSTTIGKIINPTNSFNPWNQKYHYIENLNASLYLPQLFENAVYIDSKPPQKTKNVGKQIKEYHHFVAPIEMNNSDYRVLITAREKVNSNTLYIVDAEIIPNKKRGVSAGGQKPTTKIGTPRTISISDLVNGVKIYDYNMQQDNTYTDNDIQYIPDEDSHGNKLTKEQQKYFEESKVRDENGNLKVMYHGTPNGDFTIFKEGTYFTENKAYADVYQNQGASSSGYKKTATNPTTYEVYLDIKKPFDTRNPKEREIFENEYYRQWGMGTPLQQSGLPDWMDGEDLIEFIQENGYDYDGLILDEGGVGGYGDEVQSRGLSYVVFSPEQVKNINNTKPTNDPDIRYSIGEKEVAPRGNYNVYGKDIAFEEATENSIAPKHNVAPTDSEQIVSVNEEERDSEIAEAPLGEMQVLYSLEEEQNEKIAEVDNVVTEEDTVEASELPDLESFNTKLSNYRSALEGYKTARETIETSFDDVINKKMEEYDGLKRKDTNRATTLLMQIENLRLRKDNNITTLDSKISKVESTIEKLENGIPTRRQIYHRNLVDNIKNTFTNYGFDFDSVLDNAKDKGTFASVDNTPQRFIEKSLGYKEGQILNDLTVNKVAQNESEGIKWLNSFTDKKNGELAKISKEYGIKPRSKESASAQMYAEGFWVDDDGNFIKYGDEELAKDYPNEKVRENIKKLAKDERVRKIYDETLEMINESRKRNLYPEIPKRKNYFLHFREMDDTFSRLGIPFNPNDIRMKDLPTDINGMTADLQPGQPYFASANRRIGYKTTYDLLGGVERYLNSAKNQIYHIDDIQTLRALRNYIAERFGQAKGLENLDTMDEAQALERIEQVYNSHLSTFAKFLNEEANVLAGKTSLVDRALEGTIGRRGIQFLNTVNRQVGSNMVGGNVSSALTNTVSMVQAVAKSNKFDSIKAFAQMTSNMLKSLSGKSDGFVENNPMMIRRKGIEKMTSTPWESIVDNGYILASAVDNVSSEFIVRTKFNELTRKGMDEQKAHIEADKWASKILGDRSLGQQPLLYNSKMLGLVTKFQLEVRNQLDSQFYDTIQEAKVSTEEIENGLMRNAVKVAKIGSTFVQLSVLQHIFGQAFKKMAGYNPTFDIIEVMAQMIGLDDDEDSEDTVLDNFEQGFLALLEDLPYTSTFTGGRIPIASALPIEQFITGKDDYGNEKSRWETIKETAPYYLMPTGYGQIKKTKAGLEMFSDEHPISGSYTKSGNLRFPVEDTTLNRLQAGVFGQYASKNARDYFDDDRTALQPKQIHEFKDLDIPIQEYWEIREGLSDLGSDAKLSEKGDYIGNLDLPIDKQNILINNRTDREKKIDMSTYKKYSDFEEFDLATRYPDKYKVLQEQGISAKEYNEKYKETITMYTDAYSKASEDMNKYTLSKAVAKDLKEYNKYKEALNNMKADVDKNGKTISGSAKEKKKNYIFNLDLDYGQKLILYRSLYDSKEDKNKYDSKIVDYLYGRSDISYEDMEVILEELGIDW